MYCYLLWNTITDMGYVGITKQPLWKRIRSHTHCGKSDRIITQAIRKHGTENFTLRVLGQTDTLEKLYVMEQYWIAELNTLCPHGYNRTPGGDPVLEHKHSAEARKLMGEKIKAHWDTYGHPNLGISMSEATKAKISAKARARHAAGRHPFLGRKHSEATKALLSLQHTGKPLSEAHKAKLRGHKHTPETRLAMSLAHKGQKAWNKGIPWHEITGGKLHPGRHQVEVNGVRYDSVMACHKATGISRPTIRAMIKRGEARYVPLEGAITMSDPPVLPSWRYHVSGTSRIVTTVEELQALAAGEWFESPQAAAQAAAQAQAGPSPPEGEGDEPRPRRDRR